VAKLQTFLQERGHKVTSLTKRSVGAMLTDQPAEDVRRLLELRREGAQAAARKLDSLIAGIDADQRLRGTLRFHGASTGRWSGSRLQPQNLKRRKPPAPPLTLYCPAVSSGCANSERRWRSPAICRALWSAPLPAMFLSAPISRLSRAASWPGS